MFQFASFGAGPPIHIRPYHSGVLYLIQLKMEPDFFSLIHHSIDIHIVALPQPYTEIYLHLGNVSELFWPSLYMFIDLMLMLRPIYIRIACLGI